MGLGLTDDLPPYGPMLDCRFHILDSKGFQVSLDVILPSHSKSSSWSFSIWWFPPNRSYDSRVVTMYNMPSPSQSATFDELDNIWRLVEISEFQVGPNFALFRDHVWVGSKIILRIFLSNISQMVILKPSKWNKKSLDLKAPLYVYIKHLFFTDRPTNKKIL